MEIVTDEDMMISKGKIAVAAFKVSKIKTERKMRGGESAVTLFAGLKIPH